MMCMKILIVLLVVNYSYCYIENPGPTVIATKGEVWPKPQQQIKYDNYMPIATSSFNFEITGQECEILVEAVTRYKQIIAAMTPLKENAIDNSPNSINLNDKAPKLQELKTLKIQLNKSCEEMPLMNMDERYELNVSIPSNVGEALLFSNSIWGILRGMETFTHLIYLASDEQTLFVNSTSIKDFPRFSHRGLLVDTSRHYISMDTIYKMLDAMAFNKMNVFHWHIVDDQSFPYESTTFPLLSKKGAYHSSKIYSQENVKKIIDYATKRGIRVVPEFDTPGHTRSWGEGYVDLLVKCYELGQPSGKYGPMNPTRETTYTFMKQLMQEIIQVFPEPYVHLGADEVEFECWASNPEINQYMLENHIMSYKDLEEMYIQKLINMVTGLNASSIVWEEVFTNGINMPPETVVQVWINAKTINKVTGAGFRALLSSCWYLDHLSGGGDWEKYYKCEPFEYVDSEAKEKLIMGGEACMWAESVDDTNVLSRVWPRASAVAERLWSAESITNISDAQQRLEEHTCRMNKRNIPAQPPNRAGFCLIDY